MRLATIAAGFVLFSTPLAVEAHQPGKVYRVGILTNKASDPAEVRLWQEADLIVARSSIWVQPAKEATSSIPIVFLMHADPVGTGHVTSLARPGGNITGLAAMMTDLAPKELELLISAVPVAKWIAVLWSPDAPSHTPALTAVEEAGRMLRVQLQPVGVRTAAELEGAFAAMARARAQGRSGARHRNLPRGETARG